MSAPAGWHLQPDGQERFWDGTRWTDQFRAPRAERPHRPAAAPRGPPRPTRPRRLDVDHTQAIPGSRRRPAARSAQAAYAAAGVPAAGLPAGLPAELPGAGLPAAGLPAADQRRLRRTRHPALRPAAHRRRRHGQGLPRSPRSWGCSCSPPSWSGGFYVVNRAADTISETFPSGLPTSLPTDLPLRRCPPRAWASRSTSRSVTASTCRAAPSRPAGSSRPRTAASPRRHHRDEGHARPPRTASPCSSRCPSPRRGRSRSRRVCTAPPAPSGATVDVVVRAALR